ncbi:MAG: hypothetical protein RR214_08125 [Synergistaceae bacterium]
MSRAFVKEDDGERGNAVSEIQQREGKVEWLKIQEKKLERLLSAPKNSKVSDEVLQKWIYDTRADIEKIRLELGYADSDI